MESVDSSPVKTPMPVSSYWDYVDPFTLEQAARLWNDFDPATDERGPLVPSDQRSAIQAIIQLLTGGFLSGEFPPDRTNGLEFIGNFRTSHISRGDLQRFAQSRDLRPRFLFDVVSPETTPSPKSRGGRPPEYDWDAMLGEVLRIADLDGLPERQADLVDQLLMWFEHHFGREPADSTLKQRVSMLYQGLRAAREMQVRNPRP